MRDLIGTIAGSVASPFLFLTGPTHRLYWLYLLSAAAMAVVLYLCRHRGRRAFRACMAFLLPKAIYAHRSSFLDYRFFYVNTAVFSMVLGPVVASSTIAGAIARAWGADSTVPAGPAATAALTLSILLAMDLALYLGHWLQHRVPVLWEFHKVHHSAEVLTPVTAFRAHPVDDLLNLTLTATATGIVQGVFEVACGTQVADLRVLGVNALLFTWYVSGFNLRHSHIWLSYPRWLSHIVISPAQHQIHHSKAPRHFDKNMGFIFACWDAVFGTLYVPTGKEELSYGLSGDEHLRFASVPTLYLRPFVSLWRKYARRPRLSLLQ